MDYLDQVKYIEQLSIRLKNDLYDRENIDSKKMDWILDNKYSSDEANTRCDYIKQTGERCKRPIKHVFVVKNSQTNQIYKIGSTCVKNLLGVPQKKKFNVDDFFEEVDIIKNEIKDLNEAINTLKEDNNNLLDSTSYTDEEKEHIIKKAIRNDVLPSAIKIIIDANIPLTDQDYQYLNKNVEKILLERKELNKKHSQLKKSNHNRDFLHKKEHVFKRSSKDTDVVIDLTNDIKKVFEEIHLQKVDILKDEDKLILLMKKLSHYYCRKVTLEKHKDSYATVTMTIREYYGLNAKEQVEIQKKGLDIMYRYFEEILSYEYNIKLNKKGILGFNFEYC